MDSQTQQTVTLSAEFTEEVLQMFRMLAEEYTNALLTGKHSISLDTEDMRHVVALTGIIGQALSMIMREQTPNFEPGPDNGWSKEMLAAHAKLSEQAVAHGLPPDSLIQLS